MNFTTITVNFFSEIDRIIKTKHISTIRQLYNLTQPSHSSPEEYMEYARLLDISITGKAGCNNTFKDKEMLDKIRGSMISYEEFKSVFDSVIKAFKKPINLEFINSFYIPVESLWMSQIDDMSDPYAVNLTAMIFSFLFEFVFGVFIDSDNRILGQCIGRKCNKAYLVTRKNKKWCSRECRKSNTFRKYYNGEISGLTFSELGGKKPRNIYRDLMTRGYISNGFLTNKFTGKRKDFKLSRKTDSKTTDKTFTVLNKISNRKKRIRKKSKDVIKKARETGRYFRKDA